VRTSRNSATSSARRCGQQALDWLTAEYDAAPERHSTGKAADKTAVATSVRSWLQNQDLIGVRDEAGTRESTRRRETRLASFWQKVASLGARDPAAKFAEARAYATRAEWKMAAKCYAEGIELDSTDDGDLWFEYAAAQLPCEGPTRIPPGL